MSAPAAIVTGEWGECIVPVAAVPPGLRAEVRRKIGAVPGWLCRLAPSPWLVRTLGDLVARPIAHNANTAAMSSQSM